MSTPMSDKESKFIFDKLNKIDKKLAIDFGNTEPEKRLEFVLSLEPVLEGYSAYTDNYNSIYELTGDKYKILNKLYSDFEGKVPPESSSRLFSVQKKYPFISREDMETYFSKVDEYKREQAKQDEYEIAKRKREKEVKDWPLYKDILTSEYGKARYINEPEKSVWGEGPYWNKGEDVRDMILGGTAAVSELIPGWGGALAGPAIRGTRDILNYNTPYVKNRGDIAQDIGTDILTNVAIQKLPNFRREKRMTKGMGGQNVNKYLELQDKISAQKQILDSSPTPKELQNMSNSEIYAWINNLPEGDLKNKLTKGASSLQNIDRALITEKLDLAKKAIDIAENENLRKSLKNLFDLDYTIIPDISKETIAKEAITNPELTKFEKYVSLPWAKGTRMILNDYSDQAMRLSTDAGIPIGRRKTKVEGPNINYTRDFLLGFVPDETAPDYMKKQYEQWREDYKKKYKVYPEEDPLARLEE